MTLLEILVSLAVLAMIATLIYGAFDSLGRGKKGESLRAERARQGRGAVLRIVRELSSAYLSLHVPANVAQNTRVTAFIATSSMDFDRVDFTAFAHQRTQAVEGFRSGRYRVLVATDVAARGLDIDGITHVVNYEVPSNRETYVHRVGRTGRADATGTALTLVAPEELRALHALQRSFGLELQG